MNDLSQLESQLRSWTPRQPSAGLKAKIFGAALAIEEAETELAPHRTPSWHWLAPAMAVFVVAMMSWTDGGRSSYISSSGTDETASWSHPNLAAYSSPAHVAHNVWPVATFDWTNERQTLSSAAPVLITNSTIP